MSLLDAAKAKLNWRAHASHAQGDTNEAAPEPVAAGVMPDSRAQKLSVAGWEIEGVSISGQETCVIIPRAKVAFDIGRCPQRAVFQQTVLLTHGHLDHMGGVPFHTCSRDMLGLEPSRLVCHPAYTDTLREYLGVCNKMQGSPPMAEPDILALAAGQEMTLPGSGFIVRPFATTHTIASQGYVLYSMRKKLRADLQGKSGAEIRELRLSGEEVQDTFQVPEIAFTGDTTSGFLSNAESNPVLEDVLKARLLIMEMTFLDDSVSVEEAREKGHMHLADFVTHAHRFQNEAILLIHFSPRYKRTHILEALNTWLPPALRAKCVPLLNGYA